MNIDPVLFAIIGEILLIVIVLTMAFLDTRKSSKKLH